MIIIIVIIQKYLIYQFFGKKCYLNSSLQIFKSHQELVKLKSMINLTDFIVVGELKNTFNIQLS